MTVYSQGSEIIFEVLGVHNKNKSTKIFVEKMKTKTIIGQ